MSIVRILGKNHARMQGGWLNAPDAPGACVSAGHLVYRMLRGVEIMYGVLRGVEIRMCVSPSMPHPCSGKCVFNINTNAAQLRGTDYTAPYDVGDQVLADTPPKCYEGAL